ncbi:MAG: DUF523 domain-containing protein [archaeon]
MTLKIVSACLAGIDCNYKGESSPCEKVIELVKQGKAVALCPEKLGGLPTPRPPAEQKGEKVLTDEGEDVTEEFEKGAEEVLKTAKLIKCKEAILKARSSSCGSKKIYDGTFTGTLIDGKGVTAKLLEENGIKIKNEEEI